MVMAYALVTNDSVVPCSGIEYHGFQNNISKLNLPVIHSDLGGLLATYIVEEKMFRLVALQWERVSGDDDVE